MTNLYEFSILAVGVNHEAHDFEDRFVEAGCDDATISFQRGVILLDFARRASSFQEALVSAIGNVQETGARIRGVEPSNLVTLAEIARRAKMTRAAISNYFAGTRGTNFPLPVDRVMTDSPVWSWAEVAVWLHERERLDEDQVIAARLIAEANAVFHVPAEPKCRELIDVADISDAAQAA
ncbi:MAG: hypothetical protein EOP62_11430 [Sphingomonadales bacterium]|nr:MAG: hypothetical protein EOP62_11430 [Sphingomonadales bacterium]